MSSFFEQKCFAQPFYANSKCFFSKDYWRKSGSQNVCKICSRIKVLPLSCHVSGKGCSNLIFNLIYFPHRSSFERVNLKLCPKSSLSFQTNFIYIQEALVKRQGRNSQNFLCKFVRFFVTLGLKILKL